MQGGNKHRRRRQLRKHGQTDGNPRRDKTARAAPTAARPLWPASSTSQPGKPGSEHALHPSRHQPVRTQGGRQPKGGGGGWQPSPWSTSASGHSALGRTGHDIVRPTRTDDPMRCSSQAKNEPTPNQKSNCSKQMAMRKRPQGAAKAQSAMKAGYTSPSSAIDRARSPEMMT